MDNITIVTAFFDIGREDWQKWTRNNHQYINNFKFWARIKNKMVIYTETKFKKEILDIRKLYGLENRTTLIVIDDIYSCDKNIYTKIKDVMSSNIFKSFRKHPQNPESWNAKYNYITYLKSFFVTNAIENNLVTDFAAWIDFGFAYNGKGAYPYSEEFNFIWQYNFKNKMYLFLIDEIGINKPIFDIIKNMDTYIAGNAVIGPKSLWPIYHKLCRRAVISLTDCGFADDDQTIALMAYKSNPNIFELYKISSWWGWLKELGGNHLTIRHYKKKKHKEYKKASILAYKEKQYKQALIFYLKYIMEKIKGK